MGSKNSKGSSSTTNPKEEIAVAPQPQQQPPSPLPIQKSQPQQPLQPPYLEMPLHYPTYKREDYEKMSEKKIDMLLATYGIMTVPGDLAYKRKFAIETFRWDHTNNHPKTT